MFSPWNIFSSKNVSCEKCIPRKMFLSRRVWLTLKMSLLEVWLPQKKSILRKMCLRETNFFPEKYIFSVIWFSPKNFLLNNDILINCEIFQSKRGLVSEVGRGLAYSVYMKSKYIFLLNSILEIIRKIWLKMYRIVLFQCI